MPANSAKRSRKKCTKHSNRAHSNPTTCRKNGYTYVGPVINFCRKKTMRRNWRTASTKGRQLVYMLPRFMR